MHDERRRPRSSSTPSRRCGAQPAVSGLESPEGRRGLARRSPPRSAPSAPPGWRARSRRSPAPTETITIERPAETAHGDAGSRGRWACRRRMEIWIARGGQAGGAGRDADRARRRDRPRPRRPGQHEPAVVDLVRRGGPSRDWRPRSTSAPPSPTTSTPSMSSASVAATPARCSTAQADGGRLGIVAPGSATTQRRRRGGASTRRRRHLATARPVSDAPTRRRARSRLVDRAGRPAPVVPPVASVSAARPTIARSTGHSSAPCGRLCGATRSPTSGATRPRPMSSGSGPRTTSCPRARCRRCASATSRTGCCRPRRCDRWRAAAGDPAIEERLVPLVRGLVDTWAAAAEQAARGHRPLDLSSATRSPRLPLALDGAHDVAHAVSFRFSDPTRGQSVTQWWDRRAASAPQLGPLAGSPPGSAGPPGAPAAAFPHRRLTRWLGHFALRPPCGGRRPCGPGRARCPTRRRAPPPRPARIRRVGPAPDVAPRGRRRPPGRTPARSLPSPRCPPSYGRCARPRLRRARAPATTLLTELARHSLRPARPPSRGPPPASPAHSSSRSAPTRDRPQTEIWAVRFEPARPRRARRPRARCAAPLVELRRASDRPPPTSTAACAPRSTQPPTGSTRGPRPRLAAVAGPRGRAAHPRCLWLGRRPAAPAAAGGRSYVLAPSTEQAAVAAVLRDRATPRSRRHRWHMDLTSDAIRAALRVAEDRGGSHPAESLGRTVEEIVKRPAVIDRLRTPSRADHQPLHGRLKARRVCDGAAVLEPQPTTGPAELTALGVTAAQLKALARARRRVDALGDLHVAEAALGRGQGAPGPTSRRSPRPRRPARASPPDFDVVRTPRAGRQVNDDRRRRAAHRARARRRRPSPAALADPAVAAYLDDRAGARRDVDLEEPRRRRRPGRHGHAGRRRPAPVRHRRPRHRQPARHRPRGQRGGRPGTRGPARPRHGPRLSPPPSPACPR